MELSGIQIILIFIVSAVAGMGSVLDELQTHRPLIACTVTGLILGDMTTGIIIGGTLEMIALGWMNIGAAMAPDAALASVISTILVIAGHQDIAAGIAIAMPLAAAGQVLTILCRTLTVVFQHWADGFAEKGELRGIDLCHLGALGIQALRVSVPSTLVAMYQVAGGFIVVVGYAMVINMMGAKYLMPFFFLGFVIAAFTNFNLVALGVIGLVCAIVYIQLNPKYAAVAAAPAAAAGGSSDADDDLDDELD